MLIFIAVAVILKMLRISSNVLFCPETRHQFTIKYRKELHQIITFKTLEPANV